MYLRISDRLLDIKLSHSVDCAVKFHLKSNYFAFIQYNTQHLWQLKHSSLESLGKPRKIAVNKKPKRRRKKIPLIFDGLLLTENSLTRTPIATKYDNQR